MNTTRAKKLLLEVCKWLEENKKPLSNNHRLDMLADELISARIKQFGVKPSLGLALYRKASKNYLEFRPKLFSYAIDPVEKLDTLISWFLEEQLFVIKIHDLDPQRQVSR